MPFQFLVSRYDLFSGILIMTASSLNYLLGLSDKYIAFLMTDLIIACIFNEK